MNLNIPETYYFETAVPLSNVEVMDRFLNYELDLDTEIILDDGDYVEILHKGIRYSAYAVGDYYDHKIEFEELDG